jgi:GNAT superfamily N-acetyltransferase
VARGNSGMRNDLCFVHLRAETLQRRAALLGRFYTEIYRDAFPKADQAETPDIWLPLLDDGAPDALPLIHVILACQDADELLGGVICEEYRDSHCWLATYIAVRCDARRRGVATGLMSALQDMIKAAGTANWILFLEAENPSLLSDADERQQAIARLHILDKLGAHLIPIDYVQPALAPDKRAVADLQLLCCVPDGAGDYISTARLISFLREFYKACDQSSAPALLRMCDGLQLRRTVRLEPLFPSS